MEWNSARDVFRAPTPENLWQLRGDLKEMRVPEGIPVWRVLEEFHRFLENLARSSRSREHSNLASLLDIFGVASIALEDLAVGRDRGEVARKLLATVVGEGLMVLATRQHVKAWENELTGVYASAAWFLYEEIWRVSHTARPDLTVSKRRELLDGLFAPLLEEGGSPAVKTMLVGRLFQIALLSALSEIEWTAAGRAAP